jgi:YVTN family beta-propeller protein
MTDSEPDPVVYPNASGTQQRTDAVSRRRLLAGSTAAGAAATAGCLGGENDSETTGNSGRDGGDPTERSTVFVFNTGDGTISLIDTETDEVVETRHVGLSSSFPSNQYTPQLTAAATDTLWLNVDRGIRGLTVGSLDETARLETGSGANWLEQTPDGAHLIVSARDPTHTLYRLDADPESSTFGEVTGELDRTSEGGRGDNEGPGPCDVTIHPDGQYAYVPDLFGDTLTVVDISSFEIETQINVDPIGEAPAEPWMGTVSWDGARLLVEHNEGETGTESIWDTSDPANPEEIARLTVDDGLGERPLTSEIGPDSAVGYVFTPGTNDVTVIDLIAGEVVDRLDVGGSAFVGTWGPAREQLYVPVQTANEVAVIDHASREVSTRIAVGDSPYGATAAEVRPTADETAAMLAKLAQLGVFAGSTETTYCIGECACGHQLGTE